MSEPLFRPEACQTGSLWGDSLPLAAPSGRLCTGLLLLAVMALLLFLATGSYPRRTAVMGFLEPAAGATAVPAALGGTVAALHVNEGAVVTAGQPLASLVRDQHLPGGGGLAGETAAQLAVEQQALLERFAAAQSQADAERAALDRRRLHLQQALAGAQQRLALEQQQQALAETQQQRQMALVAAGALARQAATEAQAALLLRRTAVAGAGAAVLAVQGQLAEVREQLQRWPGAQRQAKARHRAQLAQLARELARARAAGGQELLAPVSGRVSGLPLRPGAAVAPGQVVVHLEPVDGQLHAVLWVPARDAGFVRPGQAVQVRYDAFPHQRFGTFAGRVGHLDQVVRLPGEQVGPVRLQEAAFRAQVLLPGQVVQAYGQALPLRAGMTLRADVVAERRTLLQWLLDPLRSLSGGQTDGP